MTKKELLKKAYTTSLPVMGGYIVLGMGFGIVLASSGRGLPWAVAMSVFIYAGSLQFVGIGLLAGSASLLTVALTSFMVNARHVFYGISMIDNYKGAGAKKAYLIYGLTDETYSLVCNGPGSMPKNEYHWYAFFISILDQIYWIIGSVLGSVLGNVIPFDTTGIDFALTALFITVFVQQWIDNHDHRPAIIGLLSSILSLLIFGKDNFLIPAMIAITAILCFMKAKEDRNER